MPNVITAFTLLLGVISMALADDQPPSIVRKSLLTAQIDGEKTVQRVEIKEINLAAQQKTGLHIHPCPVVGYIVTGTVTFQIEGQAVQTLKAGDAFFEPANARMLHFDAGASPVRFIAYYLLGKDQHELIKMLQ